MRSCWPARLAGGDWHAVAVAAGVTRNTAIERARVLGVQPAVAQVSPSPEPERRADGALPPGHPDSWGVLAALTPSIPPEWPGVG